MSLLRPSIAGRFLRTATPATRRIVPATVRWESQTAVGTPLTTPDKGTQIEEKNVVTQQINVKHNQPDYASEVDQASSYAFEKFGAIWAS